MSRILLALFVAVGFLQAAAVELGKPTATNMRPTEPEPQQDLPFQRASQDAPICAECGSLMVVNGSCYKCENCGSTSGCS